MREEIKILEKIKEYAKLYPNKVAYKINSEILTYQELEKKSNILANHIKEECKGDCVPIIVYGHKSKYMLISFIACVKAGYAYCPIDISVPVERVNKIIDTVKPKLILATENMICTHSSTIWNYEEIREKTEFGDEIFQEYNVKEEDVFYIIFTSGSTGNPKGVQITYNCLNHFLMWSTTLNEINKKENLVFLNQAPFSFDLSVMDLYTSLATGNTLIGIDKATQSDFEKMFEIFKQNRINIWVSTPSFVNMCLADKNFNCTVLKDIDTFLFCGEILSNTVAEKIINRFENSTIINTYGPTESTVAVTGVKITRELIENNVSLPVGKPKENTFIFIQNEEHKNLGENEKGEIVIVGDTVSIGYFKEEEKTKKVFENYKIGEKNYRSYRTGDMGYIKNGQLYFCGRTDFQIKLHGYRIEIEDIENNILKNENVKNVAVIPHYEADGVNIKNLVAFIEPMIPTENSLKEGLKIKEDLKKYLPIYMIPKKIKFVEKMPMTNNCKIDRKRLKELER